MGLVLHQQTSVKKLIAIINVKKVVLIKLGLGNMRVSTCAIVTRSTVDQLTTSIPFQDTSRVSGNKLIIYIEMRQFHCFNHYLLVLLISLVLVYPVASSLYPTFCCIRLYFYYVEILRLFSLYSVDLNVSNSSRISFFLVLELLKFRPIVELSFINSPEISLLPDCFLSCML